MTVHCESRCTAYNLPLRTSVTVRGVISELRLERFLKSAGSLGKDISYGELAAEHFPCRVYRCAWHVCHIPLLDDHVSSGSQDLHRPLRISGKAGPGCCPISRISPL